MDGIDKMRQQHDAAEEMAAGMVGRIAAYRDEYDAVPILRLLRKLHALLRVHFAYEDSTLYPAMIGSKDVEAAALAQKFHDELGSLADDFEDLARRWSTCTEIAMEFEAFSIEATALLSALAARIERENDLLYPLASRIAEPPATGMRKCR